MFSIRKINPLVRAIGTMGAVMALVGGVTYAALQTNTVALTDNELTSGTPLLQISKDDLTYANTAAGPHFILTPGIPQSYTFYLQNHDTAPLTITASVPTNLSGSTLPPAKVTLTLNCGAGDVTYPLSSWAGGSAAIPGTVPASGGKVTCTEKVTLDSTYSNTGDNVVPYDINFVGNE